MPLFVELFGRRSAAAGAGVVLVVAVAAGARAMARADGVANTWFGRIPLLQRTDDFALVTGPARDTLAREAEAQTFAAGPRIITEGERGDMFYAITRGEVGVSRAGAHLATRRSGEEFGELALLYDIARTATVRAIGDVDDLVARYDDFRAVRA